MGNNQKILERRILKKTPRVKVEHRLLLQSISDGIRSGITEGEVMRELGYSESYSKSPNHLKDTNSWQKLLSEQIPDALLTNTLRGLITHKEWRARDAGLEKALKIKKKYGTTTIKHTFGDLSDDEIENEIAGVISEAIKLAEKE